MVVQFLLLLRNEDYDDDDDGDDMLIMFCRFDWKWFDSQRAKKVNCKFTASSENVS